MSTTTDSISVQAAKEHPLPEFKAGQAIGGFEVLAKVGEGMLGAVYKARDRGGRTVAIKVLRTGMLKSGVDLDKFHLETQDARTIDQPGVLRIQETGEHEGNLFFTTEFIDGGSLRDLLDDYKSRGEDVSPADMRDIIVQVLEALVSAHGTGLHRNLKPENILFRRGTGSDGKPTRRVVLADFAIAGLVDPTTFEDSDQAREGAFYLAPEMSEFQAKADASSDLYSVGAIFYEMLVGNPPVGRYLLPSEVRSDLSRKIDDLIEISLAPNHQDRFQTATDMLNAFRQTFGELFGGGQQDIRRTLLLLGVLIIVSILAAVYFKSSEKSPEELRTEEMARRAEVLNANKGQAAGSGAPSVSDPKYKDMVWIPAGRYIAGRWAAYDDGGLAGERPETIVDVPGYWIDKYEAHIPERVADPEQDPEDEEALAEIRQHNLNVAGRVDSDRTWADARALCDGFGKRLCTEDEWEKACKGPENQSYAYGNEFDGSRCPSGGYFDKYKVKDHPACVSGYGVHGLGGGVAEWTSTSRGSSYIAKPGEVGKDEQASRCAGRFDRAPTFAQIHLGVRCCAD